VRTFGTTTGQLLALRDWLVAEGVTLVGMESTGVFWKPVYYTLGDVAECWLLNAQHLKKVPGRKSDSELDRGDSGPRSGAVELCAAAGHTTAARADEIPHRACIRNPVRVNLGCGHSISVFRRCRAEAA